MLSRMLVMSHCEWLTYIGDLSMDLYEKYHEDYGLSVLYKMMLATVEPSVSGVRV